ncbi:MAG: hypothetical protein KDI13_06455 [Alphaproteobacteria bacterium]|nr:hypothetical protein [Alphaproteobacteria bacterium]
MAKKQKEKDTKQAKPARKGMGMAGRILFIFLIFACVLFRATALLVCVGMLPTIAAFMVTSGYYRAKAYAIGILNFAGCTPFILKLWGSGNDFDSVIDLLTDPIVIIVMYMSAVGGYMLNWCCVSFVSSLMYEKGKMRIKSIEKRREELVERWGEEVTGSIPLDPDGFPLESDKASLRRKF